MQNSPLRKGSLACLSYLSYDILLCLAGFYFLIVFRGSATTSILAKSRARDLAGAERILLAVGDDPCMPTEDPKTERE